MISSLFRAIFYGLIFAVLVMGLGILFIALLLNWAT